jgi:hypothetical protein
LEIFVYLPKATNPDSFPIPSKEDWCRNMQSQASLWGEEKLYTMNPEEFPKITV